MVLERQKAVHAAQLEMMKEQAKQALIQQQAQLSVSQPDVKARYCKQLISKKEPTGLGLWVLSS
jgi:hypothetical protein